MARTGWKRSQVCTWKHLGIRLPNLAHSGHLPSIRLSQAISLGWTGHLSVGGCLQDPHELCSACDDQRGSRIQSSQGAGKAGTQSPLKALE